MIRFVATYLLCVGLVGSVGCRSTPTATDIREMQSASDVFGLIETYEEVELEAEQTQIIEALVAHVQTDERARMFVVLRGLKAETPGLRVATLRALTRVAPEAPEIGAKERIELLGDGSRSVRHAAAESLAAGVSNDAILDRMLSVARAHKSHFLRSNVARLIGGVSPEATLVAAVRALLVHMAENDVAPPVREAAVQSLGRIGTLSERDRLKTLAVRDPDAQVRMAAERAAQQIVVPLESRPVVAVLPLQHGPKTKKAALQIAELLRARLSLADVCEVVDPEKLEAALAEMKKIGRFVYDGDAPNAPELGRLKVANQLVYGSVQEEGSVYTIVLNRMDVSTLAIVPGSAVTVSGYRGDLPRLEQQAADLFVERFR